MRVPRFGTSGSMGGVLVIATLLFFVSVMTVSCQVAPQVPTPAATTVVTATPSPTPQVAVATPTETSEPQEEVVSPTPTPTPTVEPMAQPTPTSTPEPTPESTPTPTATVQVPIVVATATPTVAPTPVATPVPQPTVVATPAPELTPDEESCDPWPEEIAAIIRVMEFTQEPCLKRYETLAEMPRIYQNFFRGSWPPSASDGVRKIVVVAEWLMRNDRGFELHTLAHEVCHQWQSRTVVGVEAWYATPEGAAFITGVGWQRAPESISGWVYQETSIADSRGTPYEEAATICAHWFNPEDVPLANYWPLFPREYEWSREWLPTPPP